MARHSQWIGLWLATVLVASAQVFTGRVVGVSDGDTVTVLFGDRQTQKIRLAGIDAPEKNQAFGNRAKQALSDKIFNQTVIVTSNSTDRYRRWIADLHLGERWINREMIAEGWAWWYRQYSTNALLSRAQDEALAARLGLWSDPHPLPPWDFRRQARTARARADARPVDP